MNYRYVCTIVSLGSALLLVPDLKAEGPLPPAVQINGFRWDRSPNGSSYAGSLYVSYYDNGNYLTIESPGGYLEFQSSGSAYWFSGNDWSPGYWSYTSAYTEYPSPYQDEWGEWVYPGSIYHPEESIWHDGQWVPFGMPGAYDWGSFSAGGFSSVTTSGESWPSSPPAYSEGETVHYPPALWVDGVIYYCFPESPDGPFYYRKPNSTEYYVLQGGNMSSVNASSLYYGSYVGNTDGGVFNRMGGSVDSADLRPLSSGGTPLITTTSPVYGPPQIMINGSVWTFQGTILSKDFYMGNLPGQRLTVSSDGAASLENRATGMIGNAGSYTYGVFQGLPEFVRALDEAGQLVNPKPAWQGPESVIVNGLVWYRSSEGGEAYDAYYGSQSGQVLYLYDGSVWLSDPVRNLYSGGTYINGVFQGLHASVKPGDAGGAPLPQTPQNRVRNPAGLETITGDLDIYGSLLTLGTWHDNPANPGLSLGFTDSTTALSAPVSTISFLSMRPLSQWVWAHGTVDDSGMRMMMKLDQANILTLYSPADSSSRITLDPISGSAFKGAVRIFSPTLPAPQITLDPAAGASFKGPVRIQRQGDLSMGQFMNGPQP